jgi:hypothetical protein
MANHKKEAEELFKKLNELKLDENIESLDVILIKNIETAIRRYRYYPQIVMLYIFLILTSIWLNEVYDSEYLLVVLGFVLLSGVYIMIKFDDDFSKAKKELEGK